MSTGHLLLSGSWGRSGVKVWKLLKGGGSMAMSSQEMKKKPQRLIPAFFWGTKKEGNKGFIGDYILFVLDF